ncbi:MAG: hypothetical protein WBD36_15700 [Bacteroidota bacterium]
MKTVALRKLPTGIFYTLLFASFLGCTKDDPVTVDPPLPLPPTVQGKWQGVLQNSLYFSLDLTEQGSRVSGSCTLTAQGTSWIGTANGTNTFPSVLFAINVPNYQQFQITGTFVSATEISAELNNSGFNHEPMTLIRR